MLNKHIHQEKDILRLIKKIVLTCQKNSNDDLKKHRNNATYTLTRA